MADPFPLLNPFPQVSSAWSADSEVAKCDSPVSAAQPQTAKRHIQAGPTNGVTLLGNCLSHRNTEGVKQEQIHSATIDLLRGI